MTCFVILLAYIKILSIPAHSYSVSHYKTPTNVDLSLRGPPLLRPLIKSFFMQMTPTTNTAVTLEEAESKKKQ